jgi:hypothetical protein
MSISLSISNGGLDPIPSSSSRLVRGSSFLVARPRRRIQSAVKNRRQGQQFVDAWIAATGSPRRTTSPKLRDRYLHVMVSLFQRRNSTGDTEKSHPSQPLMMGGGVNRKQISVSRPHLPVLSSSSVSAAPQALHRNSVTVPGAMNRPKFKLWLSSRLILMTQRARQ